MNAIRTHYLDTSALVKIFIDEEGSDVLKKYFNDHSVFHTTSLCFAETLGVLKAKYSRKNITEEVYLSASEELCIYAFNDTIQIDDISITEPNAYRKSKQLSKKYGIDLVDCFQIYTLLNGALSVLTGDSEPIIITADKDLAKAAKKEGLRAWDILNEASP
ncbi:MAG: type II toxin-antitoxin system VapC family toxin [Candidatus Thiodiazotropha sp.]